MNAIWRFCCAVSITIGALSQSASAQCCCEPTEQDAVDAIASAFASLAAAKSDWEDADSYLRNLGDGIELYGTYNDHLDNGDAEPDGQLEADIESNIEFGRAALDLAASGADETIDATNRLIDALDAWGAGNYGLAITDADLSDQSSMNASMDIGTYGGDLFLMESTNTDLAAAISQWASGGGGMGCP